MLALKAIALLGLSAFAAAASPVRRRGPCLSAQEGDFCSYKNRQGGTINGYCSHSNCVQPGRNAISPPVKACQNHRVGDQCKYRNKERKLRYGTCRQDDCHENPSCYWGDGICTRECNSLIFCELPDGIKE